MKKRLLLCLCTAVLAAFPARADFIRVISSREGLSNRSVLDLFQDHSGRVWAGTCEGLNVWNGRSMFLYSAGKEGLSGNLIDRIHSDGGNRIWALTDCGLDLLSQRGEILRHPQFRGVYRMLSHTPKCTLVFTQGNRLFRYDAQADRFTEEERPEGLLFEKFLDACGNGNRVWVFQTDGILTLSAEDLKVLSFQKRALTHASAHEEEAFLVDGGGTLLRYAYEGERMESLHALQADTKAHGAVSRIIRDGEDLLVAYLYDGVTRLVRHPDGSRSFSARRLNIDCGVFTLIRDRFQPIVWIATDGQGLQMYAHDRYDFHSFPYGHFSTPLSTPVRALLYDSRGTLWFGTKGDGLRRIRHFRPEVFSLRSAFSPAPAGTPADPAVYALTEGRGGIIWIGTEGQGLDWYSPADDRIRHLEGLPEELRYVHGIHEGPDGRLWVASVGEGVWEIRLQDGQPRVRSVRKLNLGPLRNDSNFWFSLLADTDGSLFLGSRGAGLVHYHPDTDRVEVFLPDTFNNSPANDIWAIRRAGNGKLYLGTGAGLFCLLPDGRLQASRVKGVIHEIREDASGLLWLSTNNGLIRYRPEEDNFTRHNDAYGLEVVEFSDGASCTDRKGNLYFGGTDGFVYISEDLRVPQRNYTPPLTVLAVSVNNRLEAVAETPQQLVISPGERLNGIEVLAMDHIDGDDYRYFYAIDDLGLDWSECGSFIPFPLAQPGRYTLKVKCLNPDTCYESPELLLSVRLQAPFWKTPLAQGLYSLLGLIVLVLTGLWFQGRRRNRRKMREKALEEMYRKETVSAQLKLLQGFAAQLERPASMLSVPIQKIGSYSHSDDYLRACAENARYYNARISHTLHLFRELSGDVPEERFTDVRLFCPAATLSDLTENYAEIARSRGIDLHVEMDEEGLWSGSQQLLTMVTDLMMTDMIFHAGPDTPARFSLKVEEGGLSLVFSLEGDWPDERISGILGKPQQTLEWLREASRKDHPIQDEMRLFICYNHLTAIGGRLEVHPDGRSGHCLQLYFPWMEVATSPATPSEGTVPGQPPQEASPGWNSISGLLTKTEVPDDPQETPEPRRVLYLGRNEEVRSLVGAALQDEFSILEPAKGESPDEAVSRTGAILVILERIDGDAVPEEEVRVLKQKPGSLHIPLIVIAKGKSDLPVDAWLQLPLTAGDIRMTATQCLQRNEQLKDYFNSQMSVWEFSEGRKLHHEDREFLEKMYGIIRSNLTDSSFSTQELASRMNMSTRRLYSRLESLINVTPGSIIREYRLAWAARLLRRTRLTISEIIWRCGYVNRGTFFLNFQRHFGCTPKEYRRQNE